MWAALGKALLSVLPKDKLLKGLLFVPLGLIVLLSLLFFGPINYAKHIPVTDETGFLHYINAAASMNSQTGLSINWQEIIAIDAVRFKQDFSKITAQTPYRYRDYFVIEETVYVACPKPTKSADDDEDEDEEEEEPDMSCTETRYYQRSLDNVLQMLVQERQLRSNQVAAVKDYLLFTLSLSGIIDDEHLGGHVQIGGDLRIKERFFVWPLPKENTRMTSAFGLRIHPITNVRSGHLGVDIAANIGTEVYAIDDGTVLRVDYIGTGGKTIHIQHSNKIVSKYLHLNGYAVNVGDSVSKGQLVGYSGNTGGSTGPHLHFQIEVNRKPVNPMNFY